MFRVSARCLRLCSFGKPCEAGVSDPRGTLGIADQQHGTPRPGRLRQAPSAYRRCLPGSTDFPCATLPLVPDAWSKLHGLRHLIAETAQEFGNRDAVLELILLVGDGAFRHAEASGFELTGSWSEPAESGFKLD